MKLRTAIAGSAVVGGAIAAYLTVVHYAHLSPICTTGGCEKVQQSSYAEVAGIPVAVLGLIADAAVLFTAAVRGVPAALAGAVIGVSGAAFSGYLLWAQLARIHAICQWCIGNDVVIALVAVLCVARALTEPDPAA
ncbi:MAG TPA: vitamin K epoxide reductase family protein [Gaiellaceae bacterium]|nr:vitamin K epoxide reductase family protein [Gaiellaceae bacterium]